MVCVDLYGTFHTAPEQGKGPTLIPPYCSDPCPGTGHSQCDDTIRAIDPDRGGAACDGRCMYHGRCCRPGSAWSRCRTDPGRTRCCWTRRNYRRRSVTGNLQQNTCIMNSPYPQTTSLSLTRTQGSHFCYPMKFPDFPRFSPDFYLYFHQDILANKNIFILFKCGLHLPLG